MKPKMRMAQVHKVEDLSPHMRRIVFSGNDLNDFPFHQESAHVKVIIPQPGTQKPKLGLYFGAKKWMRSYTIRHFDTTSKHLAIDFAVNDHNGTISGWALEAKQGDYVGIGGPGPIKHTDFKADWHLIVGDFTALPAIAATVERLPADSKGYIIVQIPTAEDKQNIRTPPNMTIQWLINSEVSKNILLEHTKAIEWLNGEPAIFIAGEASQVKTIHQYAKTQPTYKKSNTYASGYWKAKDNQRTVTPITQ